MAKSAQQSVLILQGGGALGAYQAGVYETLLKHHTTIDWVIGTSIGAINSALIAGNPPDTCLESLQAFWQSLVPATASLPGLWAGFSPLSPLSPLQSWLNQSANVETVDVLMNGVEGFFKPRYAAWDIQARLPLHEAGFYDTAPLRATLEKFIDFDYLNNGPMRISVCAVDIDDGQSKVFDSTEDWIGPEHIMASGALPPGFPPIEIEGHAYWDGGVYSNSPLEIFLEDEVKRDALCFMVDLWDPTEARPQNMAEVLTRTKSIQYASRSAEQLAAHERQQNLQRAIRALSDRLPPAARKDQELRPLIEMGCDHTINVVHLILKAAPTDQYFKDIDFSRETIQARWQAGMHDCGRALRHKAWLQPLPPHAGLIIHELPQE
ncbi:MAG: patatin-like phospholipase family protein [Burkholderiaceae bacterium]|nr:patatin-like phospholipase family protein [Burkholderiaceae bacterium]